MEHDPTRPQPRIDSHDDDATTGWRPRPRLRHIIEDQYSLEHLNAYGGIAVAFDGLPKTPIHIAFSGCQSEGLSIWTTKTHYGFRTAPTLDADLIAIRFVNRGLISRLDRDGKEHVIGYDRALLVPFDAMQEEQISANFSSITATIPTVTIVQALESLIGRRIHKLPAFHPVVDVDTVPLAALRNTLTVLHKRHADNVDHHDLITPLMQEILVYQVISHWPTIDDQIHRSFLAKSNHAVRMAIDFIEANLPKKIGITDIASAAGQSIRSLQSGFKDALGCSPVQYLIQRRLDQVHLALQSPSAQSVRSIARQWGFVHMSDFSRRYRQKFGTAPGEGRRSDA